MWTPDQRNRYFIDPLEVRTPAVRVDIDDSLLPNDVLADVDLTDGNRFRFAFHAERAGLQDTRRRLMLVSSMLDVEGSAVYPHEFWVKEGFISLHREFHLTGAFEHQLARSAFIAQEIRVNLANFNDTGLYAEATSDQPGPTTS